MVTRFNRALATAQYQPATPPTDPAQLPRYLSDEFQKIAAAVDLLQLGHKDVTYVAPEKPRDGDERLSDGVMWNPLGLGVKKQVWFDGTTNTWKAF